MASSSSYSTPCAACKFLRRKCMPGCIFAPYFPPEEPQKFAHVHKIFGASNVTKLLNELLPHQREDAVNSLAYEAEARVRDPVYGCVSAISFLQRQVQRLQKELDVANADLLRFACTDIPPPVGPNSLPMVPPGGLVGITTPSSLQVLHHHHQRPPRSAAATIEYIHNGGVSNGGGLYRQFPAAYNNNNNYTLPYTIPWADTTTASDHGIDDDAAGNGGGGGNL